MFRDKKLERGSGWATRTGVGIGGPTPFVAPKSFTVTPPNETTEYMLVSIAGVGYTDGMAVTQRPLMPVFFPNAVPVTLEFDMVTDANAPTMAQAIETDIRFCDAGGWNYNGSLQLNYEEGGEIQVFGTKVAWTDTGLTPGRCVPGVKYHVAVAYLFNTVAHTLSVLTVTVNGVVYTIPTSAQNVAAQLMNWSPGVYLQLQLDLAKAGGGFSVWFKNITLNWL